MKRISSMRTLQISRSLSLPRLVAEVKTAYDLTQPSKIWPRIPTADATPNTNPAISILGAASPLGKAPDVVAEERCCSHRGRLVDRST